MGKLGDFILYLRVDLLYLDPCQTILLEQLTLAAKVHLVVVSEERRVVESTLDREVVGRRLTP